MKEGEEEKKNLPFKCLYCDKCFPSRFLMEKHLYSEICKMNQCFQCGQCDSIFNLKRQLYNHFKCGNYCINSDTPDVCDKCNKRFHQKDPRKYTKRTYRSGLELHKEQCRMNKNHVIKKYNNIKAMDDELKILNIFSNDISNQLTPRIIII